MDCRINNWLLLSLVVGPESNLSRGRDGTICGQGPCSVSSPHKPLWPEDHDRDCLLDKVDALDRKKVLCRTPKVAMRWSIYRAIVADVPWTPAGSWSTTQAIGRECRDLWCPGHDLPWLAVDSFTVSLHSPNDMQFQNLKNGWKSHWSRQLM